jgi:hypothetical protein
VTTNRLCLSRQVRRDLVPLYFWLRVPGSPERGRNQRPDPEFASNGTSCTIENVQRLFNFFPPGMPGIALLALRIAIMLTLLTDIFAREHETSRWVQGAGLVLSAALCAGYLTPVVATLALALHAIFWSAQSLDSVLVSGIFSLNAFALAILGPGAHSVDSYRFGRRVIVLPPR